jgi:hypothetical protein
MERVGSFAYLLSWAKRVVVTVLVVSPFVLCGYWLVFTSTSVVHADVPSYPLAQDEERRFSGYIPALSPSYIYAFSTVDKPEKVLSFYADQLGHKGWHFSPCGSEVLYQSEIDRQYYKLVIETQSLGKMTRTSIVVTPSGCCFRTCGLPEEGP